MHTYGNSLNICSIRNPSRSSSPAAAFPSSVYVRVLPRPRLRRSLRQQGRSRTVSEAVDIASSWLGDFELLLRHLALWSWPETGEIYENIWTYDEHWWTMSYVPWLLDGWHLENKQWTVEKQKQVGCQWSSSILQLNLWQKLLKTAWLPHPNCDTDSSLLAMVGKEVSKPECTSKCASDKHTNNLLFLFVHKSPRFSSGFSISQVVCGYPGPERAWFILKWGEHPFEGDVGYWMFWVQCPFLYTYIYRFNGCSACSSSPAWRWVSILETSQQIWKTHVTWDIAIFLEFQVGCIPCLTTLLISDCFFIWGDPKWFDPHSQSPNSLGRFGNGGLIIEGSEEFHGFRSPSFLDREMAATAATMNTIISSRGTAKATAS